MLLPDGKRDGSEWRAGSVHGEAGKSLGVRLTGSRAGAWKDFAESGKGGDLLDLWAAGKGLSLADAIREAKDYLGVVEPKFEGHRKREYRKPDKPQCTKPKDAVLAYLTDQRKLSEATLTAYKVGGKGREIVFPFIRDGELVAAKYLGIDRPEGKKSIRQEKDCEPCLFGWQAIDPCAREVFITEGEIDAMSMSQYGYPALSVPLGGGAGDKQKWVEHEFDKLSQFDVIYLCMDADKAGYDAVTEISNRLGSHRCRIVELTRKDANDCLQAGVSKEIIQQCVQSAYTKDPNELRGANDYTNEVVREFYPPEQSHTGFSPPWQCVQGKLKFRPGEVTLIAGFTGHGKSEGTGHLTLDAMWQGEKACVASMEFKPRRWLMRLTRQVCAMGEPSIPYIRHVHEWFRDRLWVFDVVGTAKHERMLEVFEYARRRYGITLFVIDNLSKLDIDMDDYNAQRRFVDRLTDFAKAQEVHVFLVAHARKTADDSKPGGRMDVKGSGALTDLVDTVLIWWRNRAKEEKIKTGDADDKILSKPDAMVMCEKQRNGDDEPRIMLWFNRASRQYVESSHHRSRRYVDYQAAAIGVGL